MIHRCLANLLAKYDCQLCNFLFNYRIQLKKKDRNLDCKAINVPESRNYNLNNTCKEWIWGTWILLESSGLFFKLFLMSWIFYRVSYFLEPGSSSTTSSKKERFFALIAMVPDLCTYLLRHIINAFN
jgi:hypothetical protein